MVCCVHLVCIYHPLYKHMQRGVFVCVECVWTIWTDVCTMCMPVCAHRSQRSTSGIIYHSATSSFELGSLTVPRSGWVLARLTANKPWWSCCHCLPYPSLSLWLQANRTFPGVLCVWGDTELRPACLHSKCSCPPNHHPIYNVSVLFYGLNTCPSIISFRRTPVSTEHIEKFSFP